MKKITLVTILLLTATSLSAKVDPENTRRGGSHFRSKTTINDQTCEIAIPKAESLFISYTINDEVLNTLVSKGYIPYRGEIPRKGLYLDWGLSCADKWYGRKCITRGSLKKKLSNGRSAFLHADKASGSALRISEVLRSFPKCH